MNPPGRRKVLCVDDEPHVVEGLRLNLGRRFEVVTATRGADGLEVLARHPDLAVVLSDMRMPGMNGAEFLACARRARPDATRLLLTGQADLESAIAAVNEGHLFRFLTKPCPPPLLLQAVEAAVEQHRLVTAERELLEQTLRGSIKALCDVLALANPGSFGRATRLKRAVAELATRVGFEGRWLVEVAAMLSQLGQVALPEGLAERALAGQPLSDDEAKQVAQAPRLSRQLLADVPRLERVREVLAGLEEPRRGSCAVDPESRPVERATELLRVALDFDALLAAGNSPGFAVKALAAREGRYDPELLAALVELHGGGAGEEVREVGLSALRLGMVFAEDVRLTTGALLLARGNEVTPGLLERVKFWRQGSVREPVRVTLKAAPEPPP